MNVQEEQSGEPRGTYRGEVAEIDGGLAIWVQTPTDESFWADPVEIEIKTSFLIIRETLTRIGTLDEDKKTLIQQCHILSKRSRYFIAHYKELQALDGRTVDLTYDDEDIRDCTAGWLDKWGLVSIKDPERKLDCEEAAGLSDLKLKVIKSSDKDKYILEPMYEFGASKL